MPSSVSNHSNLNQSFSVKSLYEGNGRFKILRALSGIKTPRPDKQDFLTDALVRMIPERLEPRAKARQRLVQLTTDDNVWGNFAKAQRCAYATLIRNNSVGELSCYETVDPGDGFIVVVDDPSGTIEFCRSRLLDRLYLLEATTNFPRWINKNDQITIYQAFLEVFTKVHVSKKRRYAALLPEAKRVFKLYVLPQLKKYNLYSELDLSFEAFFSAVAKKTVSRASSNNLRDSFKASFSALLDFVTKYPNLDKLVEHLKKPELKAKLSEVLDDDFDYKNPQLTLKTLANVIFALVAD